MGRERGRRKDAAQRAATEAYQAGVGLVETHPLLASLAREVSLCRSEGHRTRNRCPQDGFAVVTSEGHVFVHPTRLAAPEVWLRVLAHCLLHFGFGHVRPRSRPREWNVACDVWVERFLAELKLGRRLDGAPPLPTRTERSEEKLYERLCVTGIPAELYGHGTAGPREDMVFPARSGLSKAQQARWQAGLARGLSCAVDSAVRVAAGADERLGVPAGERSVVRRARDWFVSSYPLLGALAASFEIIEDPTLCHREGVSTAAVWPEVREIYVNPAAGLDEFEARFVLAHELLHVGLRHDARREGRDAFLWNVACDYVINGWLIELGVGSPPPALLHDPELAGESAESIYDRMVTDLRRHRRLRTFAGTGVCDLRERSPDWWRRVDGVDLDAFYRRCLMQGLTYHEQVGRGLLPAGLVEEIRSLDQPPIPWDVALAYWFDDHFPPLERRRSYARPSRRQSATPDIPRPSHVDPEDGVPSRTFGVVLDTSGSMNRALLGNALGAIASYSMARDVSRVRVVFCDAVAHDAGWMAPSDLAGRVRVRGRGGTVLQPGVDLLERAHDFPEDGPLLIITDAMCDVVSVRRSHAFLTPWGARLPFKPKGPVFRLR
jgi:predicted metal-dependent peptidase